MTMPYIPEFREAAARNKWIVEHATYFTIIRRQKRQYLREEKPSFEAAEKVAQRIVKRDATARLLIYAVAGIHDALTATVSVDGTKRHE